MSKSSSLISFPVMAYLPSSAAISRACLSESSFLLVWAGSDPSVASARPAFAPDLSSAYSGGTASCFLWNYLYMLNMVMYSCMLSSTCSFDFTCLSCSSVRPVQLPFSAWLRASLRSPL